MKAHFSVVFLAFALLAGACSGETPTSADFDVSNFLISPGATEFGSVGWVVVSPAAPGDLFFDGGEDVRPGFVN